MNTASPIGQDTAPVLGDPLAAAAFASEARRQVERKVHTEQMQVMYRQLLSGMWSSVVLVGMLCWLLWPVTNHQLLQCWLGAIVATSVVRTGIALAHRRKNPADIDPLFWEKLYVWSHFFNSVVWGIGGLLVMPQDLVQYQAVIYLYLVGISCGSANLYVVQTRLKTWTLVMFVMPATVWLLLQGEWAHLTMACGGTVLLLATVRGMQAQSALLRQSYELTYELYMAKAAAEQLARTDMLTGLNNRRAFSELGAALLNQARRQKFPVSAVMLDIDHFKKINDTYGHAGGDVALMHLAQLLKSNLRESDVCGRVGGEEFALLLPGSDAHGAQLFAEKLRLLIAQSPTTYGDAQIAMTASFGVTCGGTDMDTLLRMADTALYRAKQNGRDRVEFQSSEAPT